MQKNSSPTVNEEKCEQTCIHEDVIQNVRKNLPAQDRLAELSELFKILGDSTRTMILHALSVSEMCVCDLAVLLGMSQSSISHQLRVLKQARLVKSRRDGKVVYYSLADDHVIQLFDQALRHVNE